MSDLFGTPEPAPEEDDYDIEDSHDVGQPVSLFGDMTLWPEYANPELLGLEETEAKLLEMWNSEKFPHALAICGPKGIGKATLAFHLARFILNETENESSSGLFSHAQDALFGGEDVPVTKLAVGQDTRAYKQVISGGHPDILAIGDFYKGEELADPDYKPNVEDIRKIPQFLSKTAGYGGWRIVLVDNADKMMTSAQNAILKVLEEPPKKTLMLLVVHREGAMLPTIKSRIRTLRMQPLQTQTIKELLMRDNPALDSDEADLLALLAEGSAGRAVELARSGGAEHVPKVLGMLASLKDMKASDKDVFCETMGGKANAALLMQWREILLWVIETVITAKARGIDPFADIDMSGQLTLKMAMQNFLAQGSVQDWLDVLEELKEHFYECDIRYLDGFHQVFKALDILNKGLNNNKKAA
jgi:DNA polymerase-3 subunit delta'